MKRCILVVLSLTRPRNQAIKAISIPTSHPKHRLHLLFPFLVFREFSLQSGILIKCALERSRVLSNLLTKTVVRCGSAVELPCESIILLLPPVDCRLQGALVRPQNAVLLFELQVGRVLGCNNTLLFCDFVLGREQLLTKRACLVLRVVELHLYSLLFRQFSCDIVLQGLHRVTVHDGGWCVVEQIVRVRAKAFQELVVVVQLQNNGFALLFEVVHRFFGWSHHFERVGINTGKHSFYIATGIQLIGHLLQGTRNARLPLLVMIRGPVATDIVALVPSFDFVFHLTNRLVAKLFGLLFRTQAFALLALRFDRRECVVGNGAVGNGAVGNGVVGNRAVGEGGSGGSGE